MTTLVAADLDRTLIYSRGSAGPAPRAELVVVETHRGAPRSFVTRAAARDLAELGARDVVVPVTTRTAEQLARVHLPGPPPRFAVAANGGALLEAGVPDPDWARAVRAAVATSTPLAEVEAHVRARCDPGWTASVRVAADLFVYAVLDPGTAPPELTGEEAAWAAGHGWVVSRQGRKLYWVPAGLTKSAAVAEVARRAGAGRVHAAGDSWLDRDLLAGADAGWLARHGELAVDGWRAPHVRVTTASGVRAGEQIVAGLLAGPGATARA